MDTNSHQKLPHSHASANRPVRHAARRRLGARTMASTSTHSASHCSSGVGSPACRPQPASASVWNGHAKASACTQPASSSAADQAPRIKALPRGA